MSASPKWRAQFYPADNDWLVSDKPLEVFGPATIANFDTEDDAQRFAAAYNHWEKNLTPPNPIDYNGGPGFGRRCVIPGCGRWLNLDNIKCGLHGGARLGVDEAEEAQSAESADVRALPDAQRLLDGIHAAVSFTYIEGEAARLKARIALKDAAGWPDYDGTRERLDFVEAPRDEADIAHPPNTGGTRANDDEWLFVSGVGCIACPGCGFTFDVCHVTDATGRYDCPACGCSESEAAEYFRTASTERIEARVSAQSAETTHEACHRTEHDGHTEEGTP